MSQLSFFNTLSGNVPTSIEAFKSITEEQKRAIHVKIIQALSELGEAHSEAIADHLKMPHEKIWKRMSEIESIYRPGNKLPTSTGRSAFTWKLKQSA